MDENRNDPTAADRMRRYRARQAGEDVPRIKPGPKPRATTLATPGGDAEAIALAALVPQSDFASREGVRVLLDWARDWARRAPGPGAHVRADVLADLIAGLATDAIYQVTRATEGRLPEGAADFTSLVVRQAIIEAVEYIWRIGWTQALEDEPAGPLQPSRATAGLLSQILDLAGRLSQRSPESYARHVPAAGRDEAQQQLWLLSEAAGTIGTWRDRASEALDGWDSEGAR